MEKVREQRNFEICADVIKPFEMEILTHYLNHDLTNLCYNIECRYNLTTLTESEKSHMKIDTKIIELVFECYSYYNRFGELSEIEIIKFL